MTTTPIEDIYPLSPMQQGMLFHSLYAPESGVYVEQLSCTLHGDLHLQAFERAWQEVVRRHAILRTAFVWEDLSEPLQVVHQQVRLPLEQCDWRALSQAAQEANLEAFLRADQVRGFELSQAPLMRLAIMRLAEDAYQFVWSHHHLLIDGWCQPLLLQEVLALYDAYRREQPLHLERSRPYRDYIAWLQEQEMSRAEVFWRQTLRGFTTPTSLPARRVPGSSAQQPQDYHTAHGKLSAEATAALQALARQHQLTMNTLVQGAWALLLHRYSGAEEVVFGATVSGRPPALAGAETMMGLFINTLPVRVSTPPRIPLLSWLKALQVQQAELREYEYTPLVHIQGWSEVPRGLPLFESLLIFENYPVDASLQKQNSGLKIRNVRSFARTNYPLTVVAVPGRELSLRLLYDSQCFDSDTIAQMLRHLQTLLEGFVADPEQPLATVPLLTAPERQQLLVAWNNTRTDYPHDQCIHEWFERLVQQHPTAIAVIDDDTQLTYWELNARANQLAHYLERLGIQPETLAGLCLERSIEMVVAVLGILKAGGAFLPLDPSYPTERLAYMVQDSGVSVVLTQPALAERLPALSTRVVCLDTAWEDIAREPTVNPASTTVPENLAYVIYTSGSTGQPKGTMLQHRGVCNLATAQQQAFGVQEGDRILQFSSLSFDASVWEIVMAVLSGAALGLASREHLVFGQELLDVLRQQRITIATLPPSVLAVLPEAPLPDLHTIITAGEACSQELVNRWSDGRRYVNAYGPTETTVCASMYLCTPSHQQSPPIGRPIANTQLYILDTDLQPVPIGVPGELYIGGVGLARGYLGRPELTAATFIPHPFSEVPGARLYRSGDLVRYLPDGNIAYVGRMDQQVKIRGFRIEPGEIEAVLQQHPVVRDVAVVASESVPGERRLVAYVVAPAGAAPDRGELRSFLRQRLPEYMVPSAFVLLEAMPLTPSGKVDRRALPPPDQERSALVEASVAPHTPMEELLAVIWAEVLGLEQVGRYDNFFDLGGHSLLATRLISRLREAFQVEIPVRSLFETPTVAGLAESVETAMRAGQGPQALPLLPVRRDGDLPLSFAQQRLWFLDQLVPGSASYNMPVAVRLRGSLDVVALQQSLQELVRRHEGLRTTFPSRDGQPVQVIAPALELRLPLIDVQELSESEREAAARHLAAAEAQRPFQLAHGPLLRATLLRLDTEDHVWLMTMHHIIADGWSIGLLVQEFAALYAACTAGKPSPLTALPVQYADFAAWQRQWLQGDVLETQLAYWQRQLAGSPPVLALPTDRPRPAVQTSRGAEQPLVLSRDLSKALRDLSRQEGVTLFMTLLAAWQTLLQRYSGQEEIVVGTAIANRTRAETEKMVGFFMNTLALRVHCGDDPSFRTLLHRVREVCLGAYTHQDLPFERLVDALQTERDLSHTPLFQVAFQLQHARQEVCELPALTLNAFPFDNTTAKFDLLLAMVEGQERLHGSLEYNTDLFDHTTIGRLLGHFKTLLEEIVAHPEQRLSAMSLLTAAERQQLLVAWNDTAGDYPQAQCLHHLFEVQAAQTPDAVALLYEAAHLTYDALNQRANQLAWQLQQRGVGPEVLVGICVERSLDMVLGLLGVLKAGGAYVPLDPTYPPERLAFMCADTRMPVLLTQQSLLARLPNHQARVICLDTEWDTISTASSDNPRCTVTPESLAYVIYTSGSTGTPKGVLLAHRGLCNVSEAQRHSFGLRPDDRVLQFSSFSFDASIFEIVMALRVGATLCLGRSESLLPGPACARFLQEADVTIVTLPPSALTHLPTEALPALRTITVAGEACAADLVEQWAAGRRFFNLYGPTEATIWATAAACCNGHRTPPIGRPIVNTQVFLLDQQLQPVPIGVPGELYIGGVGLARGYLNRPELTAETFMPHPWSREPGARLYKTGDLARYLPDGNIEFLGRMDHQVKLRGFRIELGEIEAALRQHPAVRETVVLVREDKPGEKRLVAYVVASQDPVPSISALRHFLQARLPVYMVPAAVVVLAGLPTTANGKIDRRALPAPEQTRPALDTAFTAPRTVPEHILAHIWSHVLGLEHVGIHDHFFELGGDSMLSIQVIARAHQAGLRLTPTQLFQCPTIAGLARVAGSAEVVRAEQGMVTGPVPLTPVQHWFFEHHQHAPHHWNWAFLRAIPQGLEPSLLARTMQYLLSHHDALRLRFHCSEGAWQQVNAPIDATAPLTVVDLTMVAAADLRQVIESAAAACQTSLHLATGPLLRVAYFACGPQQADRMLMVFHHLIVDVVSARILLEDFQTVYGQLRRGAAVCLPPKTTSFQDWSRRLAAYAQAPALRQELPYWTRIASTSVAPLPVDYPGGIHSEASVESITCSLTTEETQALRAHFPAAYGAQIQEVILTALVRSLARWTGQRTLLVELEGHGREEIADDIDLSRTVGWFTTMFPVLFDLGESAGPGEALRAVQAQMRGIPQRGMGFGLLRYLCAEHDVREPMQAIPSAAVNFNYLGQLDQTLAAAAPFKRAPESPGPERSLQGTRHHLLYIVGLIGGGTLRLRWSYSKHLYQRQTIERLASSCAEELRALLAHCRTFEGS